MIQYTHNKIFAHIYLFQACDQFFIHGLNSFMIPVTK